MLHPDDRSVVAKATHAARTLGAKSDREVMEMVLGRELSSQEYQRYYPAWKAAWKNTEPAQFAPSSVMRLSLAILNLLVSLALLYATFDLADAYFGGWRYVYGRSGDQIAAIFTLGGAILTLFSGIYILRTQAIPSARWERLKRAWRDPAN